jgi:predicted dehydrogenase
MLKIALVGCGLVADQHLIAISRIDDCEVVAVCDRELLMAEQLADRFGIAHVYTDVTEMLQSNPVEVVHLTTPPQTHYALAKQCLELGCHLYLEKPFTVSALEAEDLLATAGAMSRKMTVGHNLQFNPEALRMRDAVKAGFLGERPFHIECNQTYSHADPTYGKTLLGDRQHWVRRLPGSLLHNLISHGLGKIVEFLVDGDIQVVAVAYCSEEVKKFAQLDVIDELRVLIRDEANTTAYFTLSTQFPSAGNVVRVHGPRGTLVCDSGRRTLLRFRKRSFKSYLRFFLPPILEACQHIENTLGNATRLLRNEFHEEYGLKVLIERFYRSIRENSAPPIAPRDILLTARIMDSIFSQIRPIASTEPSRGSVLDRHNRTTRDRQGAFTAQT